MAGFDSEGAALEVARSSESKFGHDGNPISHAQGKVMKGRGDVKPDLAGILGTPAHSVEAGRAFRNGS